MIELDLTNYMKKLNFEYTQVRRPQAHYYEDENLFILLFKSREMWAYYTITYKEDIRALYPEDENVVNDFKLQYCSNVLKVLDIVTLPISVYSAVTLENTDYKKNYKVKKNEDIVDYTDIVEDATDYSDFLEKLFNGFEKKVLQGLKKLELEKIYTVSKTFPEFLRSLFNAVNTVTFAKMIKRLITEDFKTGKTSGEEELDIELPLSSDMQQKINQLYQQQLEGYTINGDKWPGIKGVTKEIQFKTIKVVQDGILENKSLKEVTRDIEDIFDGFTKSRSRVIARTETNRIINEGLLVSYKDASEKLNINLGKSVDKNTDINTSLMCHRMVHKYGNIVIPLDDMFIDDEGEGATMQEFIAPPFHYYCRRRIVSREMPKIPIKS